MPASWVLFSILAALIWAIGNTVDKYVLTRWVKNPFVSIMLVGAVEIIASVLVYLTHGFSVLSGMNLFWAVIAGTLNVLMLIFYFKAVQIEEISRVIPLYYLNPLFVSVFAAAMLGEIFDWQKYLGVALLVLGAVLVSSRNSLKFGFRQATGLMILAALTAAASDIIIKHLLDFADFWTVFAYTRIGAIFVLVPVTYLGFRDIAPMVKAHGKKVIGAIVLNESFILLAIISYVIALSSGYVTLVNALTSLQSFFTLLFVTGLSVFYPKILKEEIGRSAVLAKLVAIILMFVGAMLIT